MQVQREGVMRLLRWIIDNGLDLVIIGSVGVLCFIGGMIFRKVVE